MDRKNRYENAPRNPNELLIQAFARLDKTAMGIAVGALCGLVIFLATIFLVLKGGDVIGPNLGLLGQFFIGYSVTAEGSVVGLLYGFACGFILGWSMAFLRNSLIAIYLYTIKLKAGLSSINDYMDNM